jgi:hypothetical protein
MVDVVLNELMGLASRTLPGRAELPERVKEAARKIIEENGGDFLQSRIIRLTQDEADQTDDLLVEIQGLGASRDEARPVRHRGECASIVAAKRLGLRQRQVVFLSNDEDAIKLANNHGIACRTQVDVLKEMIHAGRIFGSQKMDADLAWDLARRMVSKVSNPRKPKGPESFAVVSPKPSGDLD